MGLIVNTNFVQENNLWKVDLIGDLDINSSIMLKDKINEILDEKEESVEFETSKLNYIDSTGLGVLISLLKRLNNYENAMSIINVQDNILKIFKITGLFKVIKIYKEGELIEG
ncbi:MAG: STAS domain-containing protein [Bacillota bacterium]|nr:STAS domain-containing protein [Bacillota bacterium]